MVWMEIHFLAFLYNCHGKCSSFSMMHVLYCFAFWSNIYLCWSISSLPLIFTCFGPFRLSLKGNSEFYSSGYCLDEECWRLYEKKVQSLLSQGLSDRAKSIRVIWRNIPSGCSLENVCCCCCYFFLILSSYLFHFFD
jgi:hypothetical protein